MNASTDRARARNKSIYPNIFEPLVGLSLLSIVAVRSPLCFAGALAQLPAPVFIPFIFAAILAAFITDAGLTPAALAPARSLFAAITALKAGPTIAVAIVWYLI